uniref:Pentatricopeptide repeat-containing protein At2g13600 family n=1 Tax=Cajanus cajan TaxID=3821 RepID=A0A151SA37_CAJCA|nr:Pentatricopeptide repeat-containing protein At2g13600 family [Cajanus cajan]
MLIRRQQFHSKASPELQNNRGFCFQDCVSLLQHLRDHKDVNCGRTLHSLFLKSALDQDVFVQNNMVRFYGDIGEVKNAQKLFDEIPQPSLVSWTSLVSCYVHVGQHEMGLSLFRGLCRSGMRPNEFGFSVALKACRVMCDPVMGKLIHGLILKSGFDSHSFCSASILHMYADCGDIENSTKVFDGVCFGERCEALWNILLNAYVEMGDVKGSLKLFHEMGHSAVARNHFTYTIIVKLCADVLDVELGRSVHGQTVKIGIENDVVVGGALIDCYIKLKLLDDARVVFQFLEEKDNVAICSLLAGFNQIGKSKEGLALYVDFLCEEKDLISWSAMLTAWVQNGYHEEALKHFAEFQTVPIFQVDESILSSCISAASGLAALDIGKCFHSWVIKVGFVVDLHVASSITDMYSKCGNIKDACKFFNTISDHNLVTLTAMIYGYAYHGLGREAIDLFNKATEDGLEPDGVTFTGVLAACSHAGLVEEGCKYFEYMKSKYNSEVTMNHYACMVDLLGRAAKLEEAEALIKEAPFQSKSILWKTFLGACSKHENAEIGDRISNILADIELNEPSTYVLLSNIYASASMWKNCIELRDKMVEGSVTKQPGSSWIQLAG